MRPIVLVAFAALAACNGGNTQPPQPVVDSDVAEAPSATEGLEQSIADALDKEADPCVDFYQYACGGWEAANELPADKSRITKSFTTIYDRNQEMLKGILEDAAANPGDSEDRKKVGTFFKTCMDEQAIETRGLASVQPLLDDVDAITDLEGWWMEVADLHLLGVDPVFSAGVEPDYKTPTYNRLGLSQGGLGLPDRDFYLEEDSAELEAAYREYAAKMLQFAGHEEAEAKTLANAVVDFEESFAQVHLPRAELRDAEKTYHPKDLAELNAMTGNLDWKAFFERTGYKGMDRFNVGTPGFFETLDTQLPQTDLATLKAYLKLQIMSSTAAYLPKEIDDAHFAFYGQTVQGQKERRPRWKRCVSRTESALGEVLGKVYVDKAFAGESKQIAVDMIKGIEAEFEKGMTDLDWMDDETRKVAIGKSQAITNKIGYPDKWRDYSGLALPEGDHLGQVLAGRTHTAKYWLDMVGKDVDKGLWYMSPQMVNAYYNPLANEIAFPAGILQPPFFSKDYPKALNYGGIGMVMAHEVSHGFDDSGRKFSATGELTEWWAPEVSTRFDERAECIVKQYEGYEIQPDLFVNGKLTLGENIADLGGLKQAHRGYMKWLEANGPEPEIAGLTNEQLFFVGFAQGWCSLRTPEIEKQFARTDTHSPPRFRVNGPVRNLPAFGKAFDCEVGAPLFPKEDEICVIW